MNVSQLRTRLPSRPAALITGSNAAQLGLDLKRLQRRVGSGEYVRIKRGAYCDARIWAEVTPRERHVMLVFAVAESNPGVVFSHWSAAALRGLPILGRWPPQVHVIADRAGGGRSEAWLRRHCIGLHESDIEEVAPGIFVTTIERTIVDMAATASFDCGVVLLDHVLHERLADAVAIADRVAAAKPHQGGRRMHDVLRFADARAESPGESWSRVRIHELGFPRPELQVERRRANGSDRPDFVWPSERVVGEFDGRGKYLKDEYLGELSPGEAVVLEKRREDRLRSDGDKVARWGWSELQHPESLRSILLTAGLPLVNAPRVRRRAS